MKNSILSVIIASFIPTVALGDVTVKFPDGERNEKYPVMHLLINDAVKPRSSRPEYTVDTIPVINGTLTFPVETAGAAQYSIPVNNKEAITLFTEPNENLTVNIISMNPFEYAVTGSELMEGVTAISKERDAAFKKAMAASKADPRDDAAIEAALTGLDTYLTDFVKANPSNPASLFAVMNIQDSELLLDTYKLLPETITTSTLYPALESRRSQVEKRVEADRKRQEFASGKNDAPAFTLKDLDGKDVSLSDFKGKWIILDFWGSWCPWCIKGFPKLKEAYAKYKPTLEVIGIDCRDKEDVWRKAVAKYELPWINLYNPETSDLLSKYLVQAFPTKAIINPEGKIVNITVGEDPTFFDELDKLMNTK